MTLHSRPPVVRVDAALLIPGRGPPVPNATLVAEGTKIVFVGKQSKLPSKYAQLEGPVVPFLLPGLWDCHVHFFGAPSFAPGVVTSTPAALAGARSARDLAATLDAGFTSVRELGGYGSQIAAAVKEGWLVGPNIYSSVSMLSQTAGHGDAREEDMAVLCSKMQQNMPFYICDGEAECQRAVRTMIRRGATVIKVATTGGGSSSDELQARQFSDTELVVMVQEAERAGLAVAAHCHGKEGIKAALRAGCRTLEHASFANDECIALMKEKDVLFVPTRTAINFALSNPQAWTPENYRKIVQLAEANLRTYTKTIRAGVRIALGTDIGLSATSLPLNHGMNGKEFVWAVEAGLTPLEAIEAGTARGPESLMINAIAHGDNESDDGEPPLTKAPKSGQLAVGFDADFIALSDNPLLDIAVLANPEKVTHVWKGGKLYKEPGKPVTILTPVH
jgi:imidazolonepropionase-like amidohydrolase